MVGGDLSAYDACADIFSALGEKIVFMGETGSGQHTKLSNQIMIAGAISGACEGMSYAVEHGLDMEKWFEVVSSGGAASRQLENIFPLIQNQDDRPGFKIRHFVKDLKLAEIEAVSKGIKLSVLEQVIKNYESLIRQGYDEKGTQSLIHQYIKHREE